MAAGKHRKQQIEAKRERKTKQMNNPSGMSKYALKVKNRE